VLAPALAVPAFKHGQSKHLAAACAPAFLFNLLGWPAGVVPVPGRVRADECVYTPGTGEGDDFAAAAAAALDGAAGLPVAVQVAGPPYADEATLGALAALEAALAAAPAGGA
jgi:fatty acid amide hydrolase